MKNIALIVPIIIFGFFTYWGFAWFCTDWNISNAPIHSLDWIIDTIGEPAFCNLAVAGSVVFPIYFFVYFRFLRKK